MATINAIANGNWNSTSTWDTGTIPTAADNVYLGGYTVTLASTTPAECANLLLHTYGITSTLGSLNVTAATATLTIGTSLIAGNNSTSTVGSIFVLGTCTAFTVTAGTFAHTGNSLNYGFIRRQGTFNTPCTITINAVYTLPAPSMTGVLVLYAMNSSTVAYDTWIWNGNITFDGYHYGSNRAFINADTSPVIDLTINGNVYFNLATNGGTGGLFLNTTSPPNPIRVVVNGNITNGGSSGNTASCYCLCLGAATTDPYGIGHSMTVTGNVALLDNYPAIIAAGGSVTVGGTVTGRSTIPTVTLSGTVTGHIARVAPGVSTVGIVQFQSTYIGTVTLGELDCRPQTTNTASMLVRVDASSVPVTINIDKIYAGACVAIQPSVNVTNTFNVNTLYTADTSTAPTVATQPAVNTTAYPAVRTVLNTMVVGNFGAWPISGLWQMKDSGSTIQARDQSNQTLVLGVSGTQPTYSDVREGVAVGMGVGTLVVPQPANVTAGVVYDNGTTGTASTVDIQPILDAVAGVQTDVTAVKTTTSATGTATAAIKAKTDQLSFITVAAVYEISDPYWDFVAIRSQFNSDFSEDKSGLTPTIGDGVVISDTVVKNGSGSAEFPGTSLGKLTYPTVQFTNPWLIEFWVYLKAWPTSSSTSILEFENADIVVGATSAGTFGIQNKARTTGAGGSSGKLLNTWYHVELACKPGNSYVTLYVNGVFNASWVASGVPSLDSVVLGRGMNGYIDDLRVTIGYNRVGTGTYLYPQTFNDTLVEPSYGRVKTTDELNVIDIKAKTDQLVFLPEGVKATTGISVGETSLAADLAELDTLLDDVKLKTDTLTFTTGVSAKSTLP